MHKRLRTRALGFPKLTCMHTAHDAATSSARRLTLRSRDGYPLAATLYEPRAAARANLVLLGALAVPQTFYAKFARGMAEAGLRVLTMDYRGVAASRPESLRGFRADLVDWAELDAPVAVEFVAKHYGDVPTLAVGHSFGGQVFALDPMSRRHIEGAFIVGSQRGYYRTFEGAARLRAQAFWFAILPTAVRVFDYLPGWVGLGADIPRGVAEQWCAWCKAEHYYLSTHPHYARALADFSGPLHAVSFTDDWYAPLVNVRWLLERYRGALVTHEHLAPEELGAREVGHFGFFSSRFSTTLWPKVVAFAERIIAGEVIQPTSNAQVA